MGETEPQEQAWQGQRERGSPILVRLILWIALRLGRPVARLLLYPITLYFLIAAPVQRAASRDYLQRVLGRRPGWRDRFAHLHAFAATILDRVFFLRGELAAFEIRVEGAEALHRALDQGRGCLLFGAHFGSFDALRAMALHDKPFEFKVLMFPEHNATLTGLLTRLNPRIGENLIPLGGIDSMLRVREVLARGEVVGLLADRADAAAETIPVDFLGGCAEFPTGPALLALLMRAPVVLGWALYRGGNRYDLRFETLDLCAAQPGQERRMLVAEWTRRYAAALERVVREAPLNWFNFYPFWKEGGVDGS